MLEKLNRASAELEAPILQASKSLMQSLAPETPDSTQIRPLCSWMYQEFINLQLVTEQGQLKAINRDDLPTREFHPPITDSQVLSISLPHHQVSDIQVLAELYPYIYKVLVNGQIMCAKVTRNAVHDSLSDEIKKLYEIKTKKFNSLIRVPQLKGLIESHTGVVGFLIDYIKSLGYNLQDALRCAQITSGPLIEEGSGPPPPAITISKTQKRNGHAKLKRNWKLYTLGTSFGAIQKYRIF